MVVLVLNYPLHLRRVDQLLPQKQSARQLPEVEIASDCSSHQVVAIIRDQHAGEGLGEADPELCLLGVVAPHGDEGFVDLLGEHLLAAGVVGERGEEGFVAVFVQDCGGLRVEEKKLLVLLRAD
jgi:hypothetical protein